MLRNFDECIEEVSKPPKRWRAEKGGEYYTVSSSGIVFSTVDCCHIYDNYSWGIGNYFKTEDEADDYRNYLLAKQRLKDSAGGFVPKQGEEAYYVFYDGEILLVSCFDRKTIPGVIYFRTFEDADNSSERYKDDWMFVINYETERL